MFIGTGGSRSMHDKMYDTYTIHPEEYRIEYINFPENMVNIPESYGMFNIFQFGEDCLKFPKFPSSICSRMNYNHLTAPSLYA
jgi:hypothetical protein